MPRKARDSRSNATPRKLRVPVAETAATFFMLKDSERIDRGETAPSWQTLVDIQNDIIPSGGPEAVEAALEVWKRLDAYRVVEGLPDSADSKRKVATFVSIACDRLDKALFPFLFADLRERQRRLCQRRPLRRDRPGPLP